MLNLLPMPSAQPLWYALVYAACGTILTFIACLPLINASLNAYRRYETRAWQQQQRMARN